MVLILLYQWKEHERQLMEEENRRILEFSKQQQAREEARMAEKKAEEEAKAAVQEQLTKKMIWERQQAEEMDRCVFSSLVPRLPLSFSHIFLFFAYNICAHEKKK
jgi:hypothetical protein